MLPASSRHGPQCVNRDPVLPAHQIAEGAERWGGCQSVAVFAPMFRAVLVGHAIARGIVPLSRAHDCNASATRHNLNSFYRGHISLSNVWRGIAPQSQSDKRGRLLARNKFTASRKTSRG